MEAALALVVESSGGGGEGDKLGKRRSEKRRSMRLKEHRGQLASALILRIRTSAEPPWSHL